MSNQTKKRWSPKEDVLLKKLVKRGLSNPEISAEMDRTPATIGWRKTLLGIASKGEKRGRKLGSKNLPKLVPVAVKPGRKPKVAKAIDPETVEAFEIQTDIKVQHIHATETEKAQIRKTLSILGVKSAFVVPKNLWNQVRTIWNSEFPEYNLRFSLITPNKTHFRVIRLA